MIRALVVWVALLCFVGVAQATGYVGVTDTTYCHRVGNGDNNCQPADVAAVIQSDADAYNADPENNGAVVAACFYPVDTDSTDVHPISQFSDAVLALASSGAARSYYVGMWSSSCDPANSFFAPAQVEILYQCSNSTTTTGPLSSCNGGNSCTMNTSVSLSVPISGPNPAASEYTPVCWQSCEYDMADASIYRDAALSFFMWGTYASTGNGCDPSSGQVPNNDVQQPNQSGGADGTSSSSAVAAVGSLQSAADAITNGQLGTFETQSSPRWSLDVLSLFGGGQSVDVACVMPAMPSFAAINTALGTSVTSSDLVVDFCDPTNVIWWWKDFAYWAFAVLTALAIWRMFYVEDKE